MLVIFLQVSGNDPRFTFQSFHEQPVCPGHPDQILYLAETLATSNEGRAVHPLIILCQQELGNSFLQYQNRYCVRLIRLIVFPHYVQYYIGIVAVELVGMLTPVGSSLMYFDAADQSSVSGPDPGFEEIGALVGIEAPGINDMESFSTGEGQLPGIEMLELPDELQEAFSNQDFGI